MHKNPLWFIFVGIIFLITIGFGGHTAYRVWDFSQYATPAVAEEISWHPVKIKEDRYVIEGKYRYIVGGKFFDGKTRLLQKKYRNRWAVERQVEIFESKGPWRVWYNSKIPSRSTLQKSFPLKECISTAVLVAIALYFLGVGYYVSYQNK